MGLKDKFIAGETTFGSPFTNGDGSSTEMTAATRQSRLHRRYSLNGNQQPAVNAMLQQYDLDGFNNTDPSPSVLDLNGRNPNAPLSTLALSDSSFANGTYRDTLNTQGISYGGTF